MKIINLLLILYLISSCKNSADLIVQPIEHERFSPQILEPGIADIKSFLNTCPENDPFISEILKDFQIKLNGNAINNISCNYPVSSLNISDFQMPLIVIQSLRVIRHMDTGTLPWTNDTLYDWMKNSIDGIDIQDGISGGFCCPKYDDKVFIAIKNLDQDNRILKRKWVGISSTIDLMIHEVRHLSSPAHTSCCGIDGGCDKVYDLNNLSSYGTQLWLNKRWLSDEIDVGLSSFNSQELSEKNQWFSYAITNFEDRFCE